MAVGYGTGKIVQQSTRSLQTFRPQQKLPSSLFYQEIE